MRVFCFFLILLLLPSTLTAQDSNRDSHGVIIGRVLSAAGGKPVQFATISIEANNKYACISDTDGHFKLRAPKGEQRIVASFVGYDTYVASINVEPNNNRKLTIELKESTTNIDKVVIRGESNSSRLNKSAYSVQSMALDELKNSSASMTDALSKVGGVKIREAGGVGSDTNISINGFTGNHVKLFIDGIALDSSNSAFSLSNMPANFAERIDVYSGVVPIEFGTDAIGGVINIVTNKDLSYRTMTLDASYSYGSFNTHSSYVNFNQVFESGITFNVNAYQNYSDNDYEIDTTVAKLTELPTGYPLIDYSDKTIYTVRRFNDAYHNETAIATIGVANKPWADVMTLKLNYSQYDNEIQTGTTQTYVYGAKERTGHSITPTFDYSKKNLFVEGLDLKLGANYSSGYTHNYDPGRYTYNWFGDKVYNPTISSQDSEQKSESLSASFISKYAPSESHEFVLSNTFNTSERISRSMDATTSNYSTWSTPSVNKKDIIGLSYRFAAAEKIEATAFGKYYWQLSEGYALNTDGDYEMMSTSEGSLGYGAAATYFVVKGLQSKLSYERAYRLPTATEIFGDEDLEVGTFSLLPEESDNINFNLSYGLELNKHYIFVDGGLIYRDTRNYIVRSVSSSVTSSSAGYSNFGSVETKGFTLSARYNYDNRLSVSGTYSDINPRNRESSIHAGTSASTVTYGARLPNQPYRYAQSDASINFYDIIKSNDSFSIAYGLFYQYEFPLNWENLGDSSTKMIVPTQLAHNITLNYSLQGGKYNLTLEVKNITNEKLYDNYSLQKAGRAFYAKFRVNINKSIE